MMSSVERDNNAFNGRNKLSNWQRCIHRIL